MGSSAIARRSSTDREVESEHVEACNVVEPRMNPSAQVRSRTGACEGRWPASRFMFVVDVELDGDPAARPAMWFENDILLPSEEPVVPPQLLERIESYCAGLVRIDVLVRDGKRWVKVNALRIERPVECEDAPKVAMLIKACADDHAEEVGVGNKYRAKLRRRLGPERERRVVTFDVETKVDQWRRKWRARFEEESDPLAMARMRRLEEVTAHNLRLIHRLGRQQRRNAVDQGHFLEGLFTLMSMYDQGLRMQEDARREQAEVQMQRVLAKLKAESSVRMWATIGPMIEGLVAQVRESALDIVPAEAGAGETPSPTEATCESLDGRDAVAPGRPEPSSV